MPIFHDFSENGKFLGTRDETLNVENLERYLNEHGPERLQGYNDALTDILGSIQNILYYESKGNTFLNTINKISKGLENFYKTQNSFLEHIQIVLSQSGDLSDELKPDANMKP